ncbi:MAG: 2-oxoacid:acceptor oxidoreductase family protein [Oscillospiraceae bacterium]|nr:2-oxoacid:acceptor oxidoreductase family protein [Oscillospiraceae bacterium]
MTEILWLGRGGQGAFTAAKILGAAYALNAGCHALAFPSFGPERRGAPVRAFTKLDHKPISDRSETEKADYIIILDDTLYSENLKNLLKSGGKILVNTRQAQAEQILPFDGDSLAKELRLPVVNTVMMGALAGVSGIVSIENLHQAIQNYMPEKIREKNKSAVQKAAEEAAAL